MELAEGYSKKRVYGSGPVPCDVMIIGEAPGAEEDESGIPFYGKAGQILNSGLKQAGISRNDVFVTNTVPFRPPGNRNPRLGEFIKVSNLLVEDYKEVKPKFVLILGAVALSFLTNLDGGITANRGWLDPMRVAFPMNTRVFATFHPSFLNYRPDMGKEFTEDLKIFSESVLTLSR